MKRVCIGLVLLFVALGMFTFAESATLDGKTFRVDGGVKGKPKSEPTDDLIFADGKMHSVGCDQFGFSAAPYTATTEKGVTKFQSTITSEKEGKIEWSGTVTGDKTEGTYVWTKNGQKPIEYWFKGTLKK